MVCSAIEGPVLAASSGTTSGWGIHSTFTANTVLISMNGCGSVQHPKPNVVAYRIVSDPQLNPGCRLAYSYDGREPGESGGSSSGASMLVHDPRSSITRLLTHEPSDLALPKFTVDEFYTGNPPPREATICNLNDNINSEFLYEMFSKYGVIEKHKIYFNPKTKKHLGLGRVVFQTVAACKHAYHELHQKPKMGNVLFLAIDSRGTILQEAYEAGVQNKLAFDSVTGKPNIPFNNKKAVIPHGKPSQSNAKPSQVTKTQTHANSTKAKPTSSISKPILNPEILEAKNKLLEFREKTNSAPPPPPGKIQRPAVRKVEKSPKEPFNEANDTGTDSDDVTESPARNSEPTISVTIEQNKKSLDDRINELLGKATRNESTEYDELSSDEELQADEEDPGTQGTPGNSMQPVAANSIPPHATVSMPIPPHVPLKTPMFAPNGFPPQPAYAVLKPPGTEDDSDRNPKMAPLIPPNNQHYYQQNSIHQHFPPSAGVMPQNSAYMGTMVQQQHHFAYVQMPARPSLRERTDKMVNESVNKINRELKFILKKDIMKKTVENAAFRELDLWIVEQTDALKQLQEEAVKLTKNENEISKNNFSSLREPETIAPLLDLSSLMDSRKTGFASFGFRNGLLPTNRSFRIKKKPQPQLDARRVESSSDDRIRQKIKPLFSNLKNISQLQRNRDEERSLEIDRDVSEEETEISLVKRDFKKVKHVNAIYSDSDFEETTERESVVKDSSQQRIVTEEEDKSGSETSSLDEEGSESEDEENDEGAKAIESDCESSPQSQTKVDEGTEDEIEELQIDVSVPHTVDSATEVDTEDDTMVEVQVTSPRSEIVEEVTDDFTSKYYASPEDDDEEEDKVQDEQPQESSISYDHCYSTVLLEMKPAANRKRPPPLDDENQQHVKQKKRKSQTERLVEETFEQASRGKAVKRQSETVQREQQDELGIQSSFMFEGVDSEDLRFLRGAYIELDSHPEIHGSFWVDTSYLVPPISPAEKPCKKKRNQNKSDSGSCARCRLYEKPQKNKGPAPKSARSSSSTQLLVRQVEYASESDAGRLSLSQSASLSRGARLEQRQLMSISQAAETDSELIKYNHLHFRKKKLTFGKSRIHNWG